MTKPTILVVEDDQDIRVGVCELLRDEGFDVVSATNGEEALALLRETKGVRAILLDVMMPVMNGATFRGEQLADSRIADVPLILVTGRDDISPMASALGASATLRKPFSDKELLRAVDSYR